MSGRTWQIPDVEKRKPVAAIEVARPTIEFQRAFIDVDRGLILGLAIERADALAGAVDVPRPRVGPRHLKPARKTAFHAPLHRMIGGISLACASVSLTDLRMKARPTWIERVDQRVGLIPGHE